MPSVLKSHVVGAFLSSTAYCVTRNTCLQWKTFEWEGVGPPDIFCIYIYIWIALHQSNYLFFGESDPLLVAKHRSL